MTHNPKSIQSRANQKGAALFMFVGFISLTRCTILSLWPGKIHKAVVIPISLFHTAEWCKYSFNQQQQNEIARIKKKKVVSHSREPSLHINSLKHTVHIVTGESSAAQESEQSHLLQFCSCFACVTDPYWRICSGQQSQEGSKPPV